MHKLIGLECWAENESTRFSFLIAAVPRTGRSLATKPEKCFETLRKPEGKGGTEQKGKVVMKAEKKPIN